MTVKDKESPMTKILSFIVASSLIAAAIAPFAYAYTVLA